MWVTEAFAGKLLYSRPQEYVHMPLVSKVSPTAKSERFFFPSIYLSVCLKYIPLFVSLSEIDTFVLQSVYKQDLL